MDCCCPLAVIGRAVLPPGLAERMARLGELDEEGALAVRAEVEALAALLRGTEGK